MTASPSSHLSPKLKSQPTTTNNTSRKTSANLALDPANPLHITLPTFRMVILADELLQQFFEYSFAASFRLSPPNAHPPHRSSTSSSAHNTLTTFSSPLPVPRAGTNAVLVPPGNKGLRGVLDNIVTDGMRVAQEVKKRMDEAQRELERNAVVQRPSGEDDEDEEDARGVDVDRSVRERDRDLLEGAEAVVGEHASGDGVDVTKAGAEGAEKGGEVGKVEQGQLIDMGEEVEKKAKGKVVEFER